MKMYDALVHLEHETPNNDPWERAVREDSNRSLDWLWLAVHVEGEKQRLCLRRAREIDPQTEYGAVKHNRRRADT